MSNEAPMKIWWSPYERLADEINDNSNEIPYIRADLVDELVEALKICLAGNGYEFDDRPAEAALKALEEE